MSPKKKIVGEIEPRKEAEFRSWSDLTAAQRDAIVDVHRWLAGFLPKNGEESDDGRRSDAQPKFRFLPRIDKERPSNVVLIDGDRGSGKTTVMVYLLAMWRQMFLRGKNGLVDPDALGFNDQTAGKKSAAAINSLKRLNSFALHSVGRLIPLQPLDLQPLPPTASLLPWLAQRVYSVFTDFTERGAAPSPWATGADHQMNSQKKWKDFLTAASHWNGNLAERRGRLDPDAYAFELDELVHSHLDMPERWRKLVDALVQDAEEHPNFLKHGVSCPVLILPIDDADMNPSRSVELLELIRKLWHRRVVVLLSGNSELFREVLSCHYLGQLRRPLESIKLSSTGRDIFGSEQMAKRLTEQKYGSVVPPHHRFRLDELSPEECEELLKDFLKLLPETSFRLEGHIASEIELAYPRNLRKIVDLNHWAKTARDASAEAAAVRLWEIAVSGLLLSPKDRDALLGVVTLDSSDVLTIDSGRVKVEPGRNKKLNVNSGAQSPLNCQVSISEVSSFEVYQISGGKGQESSPLARAIPAALMLAADVAGDGPIPAGEYYGHTYPAVEVSWPDLDVSGSIYDVFSWPLPAWKSFNEWLQFGRQWKKAVQLYSKLRDHKPSGDRDPHYEKLAGLAYAFCEIAHAVHRDEERTKGQIEEYLELKCPNNSKKLGEQLAMWGKEYEDSNKPRDEWIRWVETRAILLAAPESGLLEANAQSLLLGWEQGWRAILEERAKRDGTDADFLWKEHAKVVLRIEREARDRNRNPKKKTDLRAFDEAFSEQEGFKFFLDVTKEGGE